MVKKSAAILSRIFLWSLGLFAAAAVDKFSGTNIFDETISQAHLLIFSDQSDRKLLRLIFILSPILIVSFVAVLFISLALDVFRAFVRHPDDVFARNREMFIADIKRLHEYHFEHVEKLRFLESMMGGSAYKDPNFHYIWLDFILTDLRSALGTLFESREVNVSVFIARKVDGRPAAILSQSSRFYGKNNVARKKETRFFYYEKDNWEGFCGYAWMTGASQCGSTYHPYIGRLMGQYGHDRRYKKFDDDLHPDRSFICIPVFRKDEPASEPIFILSIDCRSPKTLRLRRNTVSILHDDINKVLEDILEHIDKGRNLEFDLRPKRVIVP